MELPDKDTLIAWDDAHVWHPFTQHSTYRQDQPLMVVEGDGHYLIDVDGNRYLDAVASIWCSPFGHRRHEIDQAIRDQLDLIAHATFLGNASGPGVVLAKRLVDLAPSGLTRVFFSDNGSTATEIAIKMAHQFCQQSGRTGRDRFMALGNGYNGDTVGAVSVGGIDLFHARFRPLLFDVVRAPSPYVYRDPDTDHLAEFERIFLENSDRLIAVILEPGMQGAGGMIPYPEGYLRRVRQLTEEHDVLLVFDEVAMGMGRSGRLFASQREGVTPDFLCIAKALTGGYLPLAATLATEAIFSAFLGAPEDGRTFFHGHTYTGNALGCVAALATLDIFENDGILEGLPAKIAHLTEELESLRSHSRVGDIRQYGLAVGVELVEDLETRSPFPVGERRGFRVCRHARDEGVFLRPLGDVVVLMPPLSVTLPEITQIVAALAHGLEVEFG